MDLADLRIFKAVVDAGSVTRAAERLHRVQSNVTTRIRQLEEDLGVALFLREGKRLRLSPAGGILLGYAERLLGLAEEARAAVDDRTPRGAFRLGAMESAAAVRLPGPLSLFHRRFPAVALELRTGNPVRLTRLLLDGELDAAVMPEPAAATPFETAPAFEEELVVIDALGRPPVASAGDLAGRPVLVFELGCPHRKRLEGWLASAGEMPARVTEIASYHAMLGCAAAGMGAALLPLSVVEAFPERRRLAVNRLPEGRNRLRSVIVWRKGARSPKIDALIAVIEENRGAPSRGG